MAASFSITRVTAFWGRLNSSFWFVPAVMALLAIALSFVLIEVDALLDVAQADNPSALFTFGPEGARAMLSVIASSMITVASLIFSITMLSLQLASSQFGPRTLGNFMRDRSNQIVLGTFIATFLYCLFVLRSVRGTEEATCFPEAFVALGTDRRAVTHFADGVLLDHYPPVCVAPDFARIAVDCFDACRRSFDLVDLLPLADDRTGVNIVDGCIDVTMPDRDRRPWTCELRGSADKCVELIVRRASKAMHANDRLHHVVRGPVRKTCDDRPSREHFRICRKHHGCHGSTRGHPRNEDTRRVHSVVIDDLLDHMTNRERFAAATLAVVGLEPVEAPDEVVGQSLPRKQERYSAFVGESGPA